MVSIEWVYNLLIYCSHVACDVFVWPMLIRPWGYHNDSNKHQLHKHRHTYIILRYPEQGLAWWMQQNQLFFFVWMKMFSFFPPVLLREFNPSWRLGIQTKLTLWKGCCWLLLNRWALCWVLLSKWNHTGYGSSMCPMQFREWALKHGIRDHKERAAWLCLTQLACIVIHLNGTQARCDSLTNTEKWRGDKLWKDQCKQKKNNQAEERVIRERWGVR